MRPVRETNRLTPQVSVPRPASRGNPTPYRYPDCPPRAAPLARTVTVDLFHGSAAGLGRGKPGVGIRCLAVRCVHLDGDIHGAGARRAERRVYSAWSAEVHHVKDH